MAAAVRAISELDPYAFTLNLGRDVEEAARVSPDGHLTYLQERLYRFLRRQIGRVPPFAFVGRPEKLTPFRHEELTPSS
ncbi:MAG: hypothetical protein IH582_09145 [Afipia sp.]|nr:hypothetical protein [Afipia sp.]